jgi:hypothetical protein
MSSNEVRWNLYNFYVNKLKIGKLKSELEEYRLFDGVKAQVISKTPICRTGESKQESVLFSEYRYKGECLNLMEYIAKLDLELNRLTSINREIESVFTHLKEPIRSIIEMRYFITPQPNDVRQRKYNWAEIAVEVGKTECNCWKIDERIIRIIQGRISFNARV